MERERQRQRKGRRNLEGETRETIRKRNLEIENWKERDGGRNLGRGKQMEKSENRNIKSKNLGEKRKEKSRQTNKGDV